MAYRVVNEVDAAGLDNRILDKKENAKEGSVKSSVVGGGGGAAQNGLSGRKMDEEEERDAVFFRLEMLGYRVGQGLVER